MNLYYIGQAINLGNIYMLAGCGASICIKSGEFNLGGEGQIYAGGFITSLVLLKLASLQNPFFSHPVFALTFSFLIAFLACGTITLFSAFLKHFRNVDFLFSTFIISNAIIPLIDGLISGPFRNSTANLLATSYIQQSYRLPILLPPSSLNITYFFATFSCILFFAFIYITAYGKKLTIYGKARDFSKYSLYNTKHLSYSSAFISGGMHGLCGALVITGTYYTCHLGFYQGMGWNSLSTALIGGASPTLFFTSSIFMGILTTFSSKFALYHNFGFDMSSLLQAIILLLISGRIKNDN